MLLLSHRLLGSTKWNSVTCDHLEVGLPLKFLYHKVCSKFGSMSYWNMPSKISENRLLISRFLVWYEIELIDKNSRGFSSRWATWTLVSHREHWEIQGFLLFNCNAFIGQFLYPGTNWDASALIPLMFWKRILLRGTEWWFEWKPWIEHIYFMCMSNIYTENVESFFVIDQLAAKMNRRAVC